VLTAHREYNGAKVILDPWHDDRVVSLALVAHRLVERPGKVKAQFGGRLQASTVVTRNGFLW
jgi:hypothetical protein